MVSSRAVLPDGAKVVSNVSGSTSFSATEKLVVQLPDGSKKQYFMKVPTHPLNLLQYGRGDNAAFMFKGEYVYTLKSIR